MRIAICGALAPIAISISVPEVEAATTHGLCVAIRPIMAAEVGVTATIRLIVGRQLKMAPVALGSASAGLLLEVLVVAEGGDGAEVPATVY